MVRGQFAQTVARIKFIVIFLPRPITMPGCLSRPVASAGPAVASRFNNPGKGKWKRKGPRTLAQWREQVGRPGERSVLTTKFLARCDEHSDPDMIMFESVGQDDPRHPDYVGPKFKFTGNWRKWDFLLEVANFRLKCDTQTSDPDTTPSTLRSGDGGWNIKIFDFKDMTGRVWDGGQHRGLVRAIMGLTKSEPTKGIFLAALIVKIITHLPVFREKAYLNLLVTRIIPILQQIFKLPVCMMLIENGQRIPQPARVPYVTRADNYKYQTVVYGMVL